MTFATTFKDRVSNRDRTKSAISVLNNAFNKDEKTKKLINKALGNFEINPVDDVNQFGQMNLVSKSKNFTKKVDLVKKTKDTPKVDLSKSSTHVNGSVNKSKVEQEKSKLPKNTVSKKKNTKGLLAKTALLAGVITPNESEGDTLVFDIEVDGVSKNDYVVAYENDHQTPVVEITAFNYTFDKDNVVGNRVATSKQFTVVLPLQSSVNINHSANYSDYSSVWYKLGEAIGGLGLSSDGIDVDKFMEATKAGWQSVTSDTAIDSAKIAGLTAVSNFLGVTSGDSAIGVGLKYAKVASGTAINPMSIGYYTNHNLQEHSFSFNLVSRNKKDNDNIQKIIALLEEYQLSRMSNNLGGILVDYPCVFQIVFRTHQHGNPIKTVFDIPDCVLQNITVNWGNGLPYFAVSMDNSPLSVQLNLQFKEMQNRTASDMLALWG